MSVDLSGFEDVSKERKSIDEKDIVQSDPEIEEDSDESVDLDETQIQLGSQARNTTIRSNSSRGSMFQAKQSSNSVFRFRSNTNDANITISADPAVKERGHAQNFNEASFEDSENF